MTSTSRPPSFDEFVHDVMSWRSLGTNGPTPDHEPPFGVRCHVLEVLTTKGLYKDVLSFRKPKAQLWVNGMQFMLDREPVSTTPSKAMGTFLKALLRLSKKTGLYPQQLQLSDQVRKDSEDPVADGSFGEVYRGDVAGRRVGIKVFRVKQSTDMKQLMKEIWKEAIIWCQLCHVNVLPCYGIYRQSIQSTRIGLVSPWMENGNVVDYLRSNPSAERLLLLSDIASGMAYLHENKIVHGDLKGVNILISSSRRACLADFGLSRVVDPNVLGWTSVRTTTDKSAGTVRWQAPELLSTADDADFRATTASDVHSYGCVGYEIMTGNMPFYDVKNIHAIPEHIRKGTRPKKPAPEDPAFKKFGLTEDIWAFIDACWTADPTLRPNAKALQESTLFILPDTRPTQQWEGASAAQFRSNIVRDECVGSRESSPTLTTKTALPTTPVSPLQHMSHASGSERPSVDDSMGESSKPNSVERTHAPFRSPYATTSPAAESRSVVMHDPYASDRPIYYPLQSPRNPLDQFRSGSAGNSPDSPSASLSPPTRFNLTQNGAQHQQYTTSAPVRRKAKRSPVGLPYESRQVGRPQQGEYNSLQPLTQSAMHPLNDANSQRGLPTSMGSPIQHMDHASGSQMPPAYGYSMQQHHQHQPYSMPDHGTTTMQQRYLPTPEPMFQPNPLPGMPRALPSLHIAYEEPPYIIDSRNGNHYQDMATRPAPLIVPSPPTTSRPPIGRALAPLHALNRAHPYKKEYQDDKALRLLTRATNSTM